MLITADRMTLCCACVCVGIQCNIRGLSSVPRFGRGRAEVAVAYARTLCRTMRAGRQRGARRYSAGVAEKDPSVAVCLGPDLHKAASPAARWTHAFPHTLALTAKT